MNTTIFTRLIVLMLIAFPLRISTPAFILTDESQPPQPDSQQPAAKQLPASQQLPAALQQQSSLPHITYLGQGPQTFTIQPPLKFLVKTYQNGQFLFVAHDPPSYKAAPDERVWTIDTVPTESIRLFDEAKSYGMVPAGCVINYVQIEDNIDARRNTFFINGKTLQVVAQGMVTYGSFTVPEAGELTFFAQDSIGMIVEPCQTAPTVAPSVTPTATTALPSPTASSTATSTATSTSTATATATGSATAPPLIITTTGTPVPTDTPTPTGTPVPTSTATTVIATPTVTASSTQPASLPSATPTTPPAATATTTATAPPLILTQTRTPTATSTAPAIVVTPVPSNTPMLTSTPVLTNTPTITRTPSATPQIILVTATPRATSNALPVTGGGPGPRELTVISMTLLGLFLLVGAGWWFLVRAYGQKR